MKQRLRQIILETVKEVAQLDQDDLPAFTVEIPNQKGHGDFATNIAMVLPKLLKRPPRDIAGQIVEKINEHKDFIDKVEIAGPGFINFFLNPNAWREVARTVLSQKVNYGRCQSKSAEKVLIEFVSANPTGPLHFGHGRGAVVGDVVARLMDYAGYDVSREYYVNDAGGQVRALALSVVYRLKELRGIKAELPEDGYRGEYVKELAEKLPQGLDSFLPGEPDEQTLADIQKFAIDAMLEDIKTDLKNFGVGFDRFASEKDVVESGRPKEAFSMLSERELLFDRDGAKWFLADEFGDEKSRVLVKNDGSFTYFATDIAYHLDKLLRGYPKLIDVWGADHHGYIQRVKASLQALGYTQEALEVILIQMVSLVRDGQPVKMSKREGEIITLRDVIEEVGSDAARFFFLMRGADSQMEFDLELAKRKTFDNPVFYVQYGHARLSSILAKANERNIPIPDPDQAEQIDLTPLELKDEIQLLKKMSVLPEVVARAADKRTPHLLVFYVQELVAEFHHYYTAHARTSPILGGDPSLISARLILVMALRQVIRCALGLLGVSAPDRMEALEAEE
jgi:arginyl-tRNA synthetase